jgi:hypothetical protein
MVALVDTSNKQPRDEREKEHIHYLPTPEEIAAECKRIRESWTRTEQHRRRAGATTDDYSEW